MTRMHTVATIAMPLVPREVAQEGVSRAQVRCAGRAEVAQEGLVSILAGLIDSSMTVKFQVQHEST